MTPRVLASTTSHRKEPLLPTLDVFARLGLFELDINLHHLLEEGVPVGDVAQAVAANRLRVWVVSGGWCDFFHGPPAIDDTWKSIDGQVHIARRLGVGTLRLFFGRLTEAAYGPGPLDRIGGNLQTLSEQYPDMTFVFENHDGASLVPAICRAVLAKTDRPTMRSTGRSQASGTRNGATRNRAIRIAWCSISATRARSAACAASLGRALQPQGVESRISGCTWGMG